MPPHWIVGVRDLPVSELAKFDRKLAHIVVAINEDQKMATNLTGASSLADAIRTRMQAAKAKVAATHDNLNKALDAFEASAGQADAMTKLIEAEAADLQASLGLNTNGGPTG